MKISEMSTDQASDVIVRIVEPVSSIMHDTKTVDMLETMMKTKSDSWFDFVATNLTTVVTVLLKDHRADVFEIVAALNGKTSEKIKKQRILDTIDDIRNSVDKDLLDFFKSYAGSTEEASAS